MTKTEIFKILLIFLNVFLLMATFFFIALRIYLQKKLKEAVVYVRAAIIFCLVLLFTQYAVYADMRYIEPNWIKIEKIEIKNHRFPDSISNVKIVQITDLHIKKNGFRERSLVAKVNALDPDILLITGDFLTAQKYMSTTLGVLSKLRAKKGIYGVFGNHDHDVADLTKFKIALNNIGIRILDNERVRVPVNDKDGIWLIGMAQSGLDADMARTLYSGIDLNEPKIMLVHYPEAIYSEYINKNNTDIVLSGDTHGGQIGIGVIRNLSMFEVNHPYISGLFNVRGIPLYVNRGIGMRRKNIRFFCRPEITVIELSKS